MTLGRQETWYVPSDSNKKAPKLLFFNFPPQFFIASTDYDMEQAEMFTVLKAEGNTLG